MQQNSSHNDEKSSHGVLSWLEAHGLVTVVDRPGHLEVDCKKEKALEAPQPVAKRKAEPKTKKGELEHFFGKEVASSGSLSTSRA